MPTTIKVPTELRDRLKAQATEHGRTLGEHLECLVEAADREARFALLRRQIAETPVESRASYLEEASAWDTVTGDGLPAEDFSDWPGYAAP
jgi:hypothetical protein